MPKAPAKQRKSAYCFDKKRVQHRPIQNPAAFWKNKKDMKHVPAPSPFPPFLAKQKILICGAGGLSGWAAAKLCYMLGAKVILSDKQSPSQPCRSSWREKKRWEDLRPRQDPEILEKSQPDAVLTAPGLPSHLPILEEAKSRRLPIYSEHDFAFAMLCKLYKHKGASLPYIFAVTGTDGKSTCCALLAELLSAVQKPKCKTAICGNFGRPLSDLLLSMESYDILVIECSSFQLERLQSFAPQTALFLNLSEDHQERYSSQEAYLQAKLNITSRQAPQDLIIYDEALHKSVLARLASYKAPPRSKSVERSQSRVSSFSFRKKRLLSIDKLKLRGTHNVHNIHFVLHALEDFSQRRHIQWDFAKLADKLAGFGGLAHRLEYVKSLALAPKLYLDCYNDSKATNLQSLQAAIASFPEYAYLFVLCGGRAKGAGFASLLSLKEVKHDMPKLRFFAFGESASNICRQLKIRPAYPDLQSAVAAAWDTAQNCAMKLRDQYKTKSRQNPSPRFALLLSPGCASFDAYQNYKQRGEHFRSLIEKHIPQSHS